MISQARLKRKTRASPNGIASGLKRKREEDEEVTVDARVKRQYEYIQEGGGEAMVVVNTRDFHRRPVSQPGPRTPQRRNTIAMGDLRSPPLVREREVESEETRISSRGTKPPPPMRTTSLKTVTAGVAANELLGSSDPVEIPFEGTMVQRWSSEQNPEAVINGPERPSSSNAVLESWYTSNHLSPDQELVHDQGTSTSNGPRKSSPTTNGFVTPVDNVESKLLAGKAPSKGLSASLAPGLRTALVSRLESCLIDLGSPADNMTLAR